MRDTVLRGARTNNLDGVSLDLHAGQVVAITGVSGAGKSSLALDTLYAEGQRRYVESFSPYARQFLERLERPPTDRLEPVPAAVAVDRSAPVKSSRSTVATMADLEAYLAALFARESIPVCPEHEVPAHFLDLEQATDVALERATADRAVMTYRIFVDDAEQYLSVRDGLAHDGFSRLWVGGETRDLEGVKPSEIVDEGRAHVITDRLGTKKPSRGRFTAAIEQAWGRGGGVAEMHLPGRDAPVILRRGYSCPVCAYKMDAPSPRLFSTESPLAACPTCRGFGRTMGIDWDRVLPDPRKSLDGGAIKPWSGRSTSSERTALRKLCRRHGIPMDVPWGQLTAEQQHLVKYGDDHAECGIAEWFQWLETKTYKMHVRVLLARYRSYDRCEDCDGTRFSDRVLRYQVDGLNIGQWHQLEISECRARLDALKTRTGQGELARKELASRLTYLDRVGLGYLSLDRQARTLSGGEAQRVTLTAALGTSLHNAMFVLDEPTVGLHALDVEPLTQIVGELAERGNVVLLVEHDATMIRAADRVVELGPGAGAEGGKLSFDGSPAEARKANTATARALAADTPPKAKRRKPKSWLTLTGARQHNLQGVDVKVPLGVVCAVTGPSGSGKSTLAVGTLYPAVARAIGDYSTPVPGKHTSLRGGEAVTSVTLVDQSPLGRTSRGNTGTYTKAWDQIRKLLSDEPLAKARGYTPSHFSFNVEGGRCTACAGEGHETVEMQFLADVRLVCPVCQGKRFQHAVLEVTTRGRSVAELLDMTVTELLATFADKPAILRALGPVKQLGLGYVRIGQSLSTLSGGEAQRLKLARALGESRRGQLFVLDEPSAGLHADEVEKVLAALDVLVAKGASVIVVEHDLQVIGRADWIVDLGPGGGRHGGRLVAHGTPEDVAKAKSRTGEALSRAAKASRPRRAATPRAPHKKKQVAQLSVTNAREHNLRGVDAAIPHGALTVVTGPSGSGKSTLTFDVVFAEGQRRFLETLTPYARQFLPTMPRPSVDSVTGVPPSIALEQRTSRAGSKSTVATVTEVAHYLRLLFAKIAVPHCPDHDHPLQSSSPRDAYDRARSVTGDFAVFAPAVRSRKGIYLDLFAQAARARIDEAFVDGKWVVTDKPPRLEKNKEHDIDLLITEASGKTLAFADFERALVWGKGDVKLRPHDPNAEEILLSTRGECPTCRRSVPVLDPRWFSFNTDQGRCATCQGDGVVLEGGATPTRRRRRRRAKKKKAEKKADGAPSTLAPCPDCHGARLAPIPRGARLLGVRYHEVVQRSVGAALDLARSWKFTGSQKELARAAHAELLRRLQFLCDVGLDYLSLDRGAGTLSGGEMQRLRLAAQLGAGLTGSLYVLDEPTIGLHPRDTERLLGNLRKLVDLGSTVVVVEHDADTIRAADHLIDMGPGGGVRGGTVVAAGKPSTVLKSAASPTAIALRGGATQRARLPVPKSHSRLVLHGAREHNLKDVTLEIPHGRLTVVAGVSGSGKSTLVRQILLPAARQALGLVTDAAGAHDGIDGIDGIFRAISVDQSPIGKTSRSVPATFLGIWDAIRKIYAASPDAQVRGFGATRFSFNTSGGGQCSTCAGQGVVTHEMSFLPDVISECPACEGTRFESQTLAVRYRDLSIADALNLSAEEAVDHFQNHPKIAAPLKVLDALGAGYVKLGQGSHTLSGGEAQRLKLASELTAGTRHQATLYVLDEPTTGLHLADVGKLVSVLSRLVERGDTVVVIEHHPEVIAGADWVVELGPDGGERGGQLLAAMPPDKLAKRRTPTGAVLRALRA